MEDLVLHSSQFLTAEEVIRASFVFPVLVPFRQAAFRVGQLLGKRVGDVFPVIEVDVVGLNAATLEAVASALATMRRFGKASRLLLRSSCLCASEMVETNSGDAASWALLTDADLLLPRAVLDRPDCKI
ncbi:UNVERIFIED_CONTAM: hypothetical protein HDU68_012071, partial [Siphonaria sp. JEL0065]